MPNQSIEPDLPRISPETAPGASFEGGDGQSFAQRFLFIFEHESNSAIARRLNTNHATIKPYVDGTRMPTSDLLLRIHRVTGVNIHWLLTGRGPMRLPSSQIFTSEQEKSIEEAARASNRSFDEMVQHLTMTALEFRKRV